VRHQCKMPPSCEQENSDNNLFKVRLLNRGTFVGVGDPASSVTRAQFRDRGMLIKDNLLVWLLPLLCHTVYLSVLLMKE
jgi:hypothetical protein